MILILPSRGRWKAESTSVAGYRHPDGVPVRRRSHIQVLTGSGVG